MRRWICAIAVALAMQALADPAIPAPSEAELAVAAVRDNDPASLSFEDFEVVLRNRDASPANREAAEKVWQAIQRMQKNGAAKLKLPVTIVSAKATVIEAAITEDNANAKHADLQVSMARPLAHPPATGTRVEVTGVLIGYRARPFLFFMQDGAL